MKIGSKFTSARLLKTKMHTFETGLEFTFTRLVNERAGAFTDKDGRTVNIPFGMAYKCFIGFPKPPTTATLERWSFDGVAMSLDGFRVEPDGMSPNGLPSWLLALGMI